MKYLDRHFGINQITSYVVVPDEELRDKVTDRDLTSGQFHALAAELRGLKKIQGQALLAQQKTDHMASQRAKLIATLDSAQNIREASEPSSKQLLERKRLEKAHARDATQSQARKLKINQWSQEIKELGAKLALHREKVSRLEQVIQEDYVRLDPLRKPLMDGVKMTARNLFVAALAPFKKAYHNFWNHHDYFRELILSSGVWKWDP